MKMNLPDLADPLWFLACTALLFAIVTGRYFLIAGLFHLLFYVWRPSRWRHRKISPRSYPPKQFRREMGWSCLTAFIFAVSGSAILLFFQKGWTKLYTNIHDYPLWWLPFSFLLSLVIHETYYYWLHRWMHRPAVFRVVHKVHHDSNITSPWTAFSFHPIEGFFQAVFLPLFLLVVPMHLYVLLAQLTIMTFSSVINHLDIEVYPKRFHRHFIGRWLIGATHHSLHHKQFRYNFGLYFTFWDKWKRTESPRFDQLFEEKTGSFNRPADH
jgi:lathosterol oxidase